MRNFIFIVLLMLAASYSALAEQGSLTIELERGAVLVRGIEETVLEIEEKAPEWKKLDISPAEMKELIEKEYGGLVEIETFIQPELAAETQREKATMTVREAVLAGAVPPFEGLDPAKAATVLEYFGFTAIPENEFEKLSEADRVKRFYIARGTIAIFSGTSQGDTLVLYTLPENISGAE